MKMPLAGPNAMRGIRVLLIAICIIAVTPRLSADIILLSRLSDVDATATGGGSIGPQSQTDFLPAYLCTYAVGTGVGLYDNASSTSNSSILMNDPVEGLRVVGDGIAKASAGSAFSGGGGAGGSASAKLIVVSFTLTEVSYPYSITGQLNGWSCLLHQCAQARAKLTGETGTIFEKVGTTLSESGTLPPGNYTLSVEVNAEIDLQSVGSASTSSDANFIFALDGPNSAPTPTPTPAPATHATNLSTRLLVGTGNNVGIGGFIVTGNGRRHLLIRGIGPSLSGVIISALPDPQLELPQSCNTLTNNDWRDTQEAEVIATGWVPSNDLESAIVADLAPGAYTAVLSGNSETTGVGLVEIYDLSTNQDSRLANLSTRGNVGTGDEIMIAGFILGQSSGGDQLILRGLGPSLNVDGALPDPRLDLVDSQGALIASDDNWMDDPNQAAIIQAAGLAPSNNLESAIAATLMPGTYTALLSGVNNGTGVALVEVYDNPVIGPTPSFISDESSTPSRTPAEILACRK